MQTSKEIERGVTDEAPQAAGTVRLRQAEDLGACAPIRYIDETLESQAVKASRTRVARGANLCQVQTAPSEGVANKMILLVANKCGVSQIFHGNMSYSGS